MLEMSEKRHACDIVMSVQMVYVIFGDKNEHIAVYPKSRRIK